MIRNQDLTTLFALVVLLVFYFFQIFQRVKLVYLFRSVKYHFRNILIPYSSDDLGISGTGTSVINYYPLFLYILFFAHKCSNDDIFWDMVNLKGSIKFDGMSNDLFLRFLNFNILILATLFIRFLIIQYVLGMFLNSKLKFIFYKNYIINIIIGY